jgi:hypothetical protein
MRKVYPFIRRRPVTTLQGDTEIEIEVAKLTLDNESSKTYIFEQVFGGTPTVTLTPKDVNVNVFISSVSSTSVTINTSDPTQAEIQLTAIYIGDD